MIPQSSWYSNVRSNVKPSRWNAIRKKCYALANNKCEICGETGKSYGAKHDVECHEIWQYNDETKEQKLIGLIALCPRCHKVKHIGLTQMRGENEIAIKQLMKVNKMTRQEAWDYIRKAYDKWQERSRYEWKLDTSMLEGY